MSAHHFSTVTCRNQGALPREYNVVEICYITAICYNENYSSISEGSLQVALR